MKQIILKSMSFVNFKGFRGETFTFKEGVTSFHGRNGSGKTTMFDGFMWLLFGKDSQDRKQFELKTLDKNGVVIPRLPHEVSAELLVDGGSVTLTRRFNEKWVKHKGHEEETFEGHEEERIYNGVPCSVREWKEKIDNICEEGLFKYITNPNYFCTRHEDVQRDMLMRFAGGVSDSQVAEGNAEFESLIAKITTENKTLEEYKRELAAVRRNTKAECDAIPQRIDERQREVASLADNFEQIEKELSEKEKRYVELSKAITDASALSQNAINERCQLVDRLSEHQVAIKKRTNEIKAAIYADYDAQIEAQKQVKEHIASIERDIKAIERKRDIASDEKAELERQVARLASDRETLIAEWHAINNRTFTMNENEMSCPTCGRVYDLDTITEKEDALREKFNLRRAQDLEDNNRKGAALKTKRENLENQIADKQEEINDYTSKVTDKQKKLDEAKASSILNEVLVKPDEAKAIEEDVTIKAHNEAITTINAEIDAKKTLDTDMELDKVKKEQSALVEEINALKRRAGKKEDIARNEKRIEDLTKQQREIADKLTEIEGKCFTIEEFERAKIRAVEKSINAMFDTVTFKMFAQQVNGEMVETCEAVVDGVPYSVLNNAAKINAGLEIIKVISNKMGVSAPIFIDNAESVVKLVETGQQIRLYVKDIGLTKIEL